MSWLGNRNCALLNRVKCSQQNCRVSSSRKILFSCVANSAVLLVVLSGCGPRATEPTSALHDSPESGFVKSDFRQSEKVPPQVTPQFIDVASQSGIRFTYFNDAVPGRFLLPEVMGGGAGWLDFDRDGLLDLMLTNGCRLPKHYDTPADVHRRLFRNVGDGRFEDVSVFAAFVGQEFGQGCCMADLNADGFDDIYLTNYGPNALLLNNGDGTFCDVTEPSNVGDPMWSTGAAWLDADSDGDEDLYVVNYLNVTMENHKTCRYDDILGYCGPGSFEGVPDRLYLNQGDGRFVESAAQLGFLRPSGPDKGMSVVVLDLDNDLIPEVYVANDMEANSLFTRQVHSRDIDPTVNYREMAVDGGCAVGGGGQVEASMGIACADYDGDGNTDLMLTHYFSQKNTLYRNLGGLQFHDDSYVSRIAPISMLFVGFGVIALDYDRDMAPDLFIANGHVLGPNLEPNEMTAQLLRNNGRGHFEDVSSSAGEYFSEKRLGRGVASADYDNDGDLDLAVASLHRPVALLRNDTPTGRHFIGLQLSTPHRVRPIGGRVVVTCNGKRQVQSVVSGGSYLAASDTRLLFGLSDSDVADSVQILWPSGRVDEFRNLRGDRYWVVLEGTDPR